MQFLIDNRMELMSVLSFVVLFGVTLVIFYLLDINTRQRRIVERIKRGGVSGTPESGDGLDASLENQEAPSSILSFFNFLGKRTLSENKLDEYTGKRIKFLKAGIKSSSAQATFWGAKCFLGMALPLIFLTYRFLFLVKSMTVPLSLAVFVVMALIGFYLPELYLYNKTLQRKEALLKSLPDALDLLVICVQAGMAIDNAFNRVAREIKLSHPELSDEFILMNLELRAGNSRKNALQNLARRTDLSEIGSLTALLIQTDTFGTSISSALNIFSSTLKEKRFQKAEEIAAKLPVKLLLPLIFFIFPSLFVVLLGPAAIKIYQNIILK